MARVVSGAVGFIEDIRPKFSDGVVACMKRVGLDLSDWQSVRARADRIAGRIRGVGGSRMPPPPDAAWPEADIRLFERWVGEGAPLYRADAYSAYFRELDAHTEYAAAYGNNGANNWMPLLDEGVWDAVIPAWLKFADLPASQSGPRKAAHGKWLASLAPAGTRANVKALDERLVSLLTAHFSGDNGTAKMLDAFEYFGRNVLPQDADRYDRAMATFGAADFRVQPDSDGVPPARAHRMDGAVMWFRWAGFLVSAVEVVGREDAHHSLRTANLAALCTGCAFDFAFRQRERTRPEYAADAATEKLLRQKGEYLATDWDAAVEEVQELLQLFT